MKIGKLLGGLVLALLVATAAGMALTWAPDRQVSELQARWAPPPSAFVKVMGMDVHYRDEGPRNDPSPISSIRTTRPARPSVT